MTKKILLIDNYDSFTYNLYDYFLQLGTECTVVRNDEWTKEDLINFSFDGLVLSPGPKRPKDAGLLMWIIDFFHNKKPMLGICLGHQGIGEYFGASLVKAKRPMHGKTSQITHNGSELFHDLPSPLQVMRYHSLVLNSFNHLDLTITSTTNKNEIMSFQHVKFPIYAVQFHPESILTPNGIKILENWLKKVPLK